MSPAYSDRVSGYHMKMVGSGRGGWEVPGESVTSGRFRADARDGRGHPRLRRRLAQTRDRALAVRSDQGSARLGRGVPRLSPASRSTRRRRSSGSTTTASAACGTSRSATDMYLRSDYYTNDERWEVTGRKGFARVNRCTGRGIQQPSVEIYRRRRDAIVPRSRRRLGEQLSRLRPPLARAGCTPARVRSCGAAKKPLRSLRFALAAYESSDQGGVGVNPTSLNLEGRIATNA